MNCINCQATPLHDTAVILERINVKGLTGEWICRTCLKSAESAECRFVYIHSNNCPNYCDYACNGHEGFNLADKINTNLDPQLLKELTQ